MENRRWTGQFDRNGNRIHEFDILKTDSGAFMYVVYRGDMDRFVARFLKGASVDIDTTWEVVGDVFKNLDLLEPITSKEEEPLYRKEKYDNLLANVVNLIAAWESLEGGRNYTAKEVGQWLLNDMKPAIDTLREDIKTK